MSHASLVKAPPRYQTGLHEPRLRVDFKARAMAELITTWMFNIHRDVKHPEKSAIIAAGNPAMVWGQTREIIFSRPRLLARRTGTGFTSGT